MSPTRASRTLRQAVALAACFLALLPPILVLAPVADARDPAVGDAFEFDHRIFLDNGEGDYAGYSETTESHYRYEVASVASDLVTVRVVGSWRWSASDGTSDSGSDDFTFTFDRATRKYVMGDDLGGAFADPSIWFWIPVPLARGQSVDLLVDWLGVVELDSTVWVGLVPKKGLMLETSGTYTRADVYGFFDVTYHDRYWFDRDSGFIIAELYEEFDRGATASFRWREEIFVTSSSYPVPVDFVLFGAVDLGLPALGAVGVALAVRRVRGPWKVPGTSGLGKVVVRRIRRPGQLDGLAPDASRFFSPFLPTFARRALASGDRVLAATSGPTIVGLFTDDRESGLGSLFARDGFVARFLLRKLKASDFFLEANGTSWDLPARAIDAFDILELKDPQPAPFDAAVVEPMTPAHLPHVRAIAEHVYQGRASSWIESSFHDGDVAFVARSGERIVGFGFATVVGTDARLHSLTVVPSHRARGIGSEIMAARLSALAALGVTRAIVEISQHNAASLRVAYRFGFAPIGRSVHHSTQAQTLVLAYQRQF